MAQTSLQEVRAKFPQYDDLSDEQLARGLHDAYYADMPFEEFASSIGYAPRTGMQQAGRYAGLAGRAAVQAVPSALGGLPALGLDAYDSLVNLTARGMNATGIPALQTNYVQPWRHTQALNRAGVAAADALGMTRPETQGEATAVKYGTDILGALGAAGAAGAGAKLLKGSVAEMPLGLLAENPVQQGIGAGAATYAADYFAEHPEVMRDFAAKLSSDPATQANLAMLGTMGGTMAAGAAAPGGAGSAGNVGTRALQLVRPFSEAGQRGIAGTVLRNFATNPDAAIENLGRSREILPGSMPMTGEVAGDAGLAGAQGPILKGLDTRNLAGERASERNAVRVGELRRLSGANPKQGSLQTGLEYATDKRARITGPMREDAFAGANVPPDVLNSATSQAVGSTIDRILNSEVGTRADVQKAMEWVRGRLGQDINTPERLYSIRKDLRDASIGKYNQDVPSLKLAKGQLEDVIRSVDDVIEAAAPGYNAYMRRYAQMSKPIDQMEIIDHLRRSAESATIDATRSGGMAAQFPVLMAGKLRAALESKMMEREGAKLSPVQQRTVDRIFADLRSEMSVTGGNRMVRQPGSDTFKNMTVSNVVGHILGDYLGSTQAAKSITAPFQWLYKLPDNKVSDLLVESMLDPQLAKNLMQEASVVKIQKFSEALKNKAVAQGLVNQAGEYINPESPEVK